MKRKISSIYGGSSIRRPINSSAASGLSSPSRKRGGEGGVWIHDLEVIRSYLGGNQLRKSKTDEKVMRKKTQAIEKSLQRIKRIRNDNKAAIQREIATMRNEQFLLRYGKKLNQAETSSSKGRISTEGNDYGDATER